MLSHKLYISSLAEHTKCAHAYTSQKPLTSSANTSTGLLLSNPPSRHPPSRPPCNASRAAAATSSEGQGAHLLKGVLQLCMEQLDRLAAVPAPVPAGEVVLHQVARDRRDNHLARPTLQLVVELVDRVVLGLAALLFGASALALTRGGGGGGGPGIAGRMTRSTASVGRWGYG